MVKSFQIFVTEENLASQRSKIIFQMNIFSLGIKYPYEKMNFMPWTRIKIYLKKGKFFIQ